MTSQAHRVNFYGHNSEPFHRDLDLNPVRAVIGSKAFVNEAFAGARERRKDGARKMRGSGAAAKGVLWNIWDLRLGG